MNGQIQRIRAALAAYQVPGSLVSKADCLAEIQRIADEHHVDLHTDDVAVDVFASVMKKKLAAARDQGRTGWEQCDPDVLSQMLRAHVEKGDPRDVANFCCFLWVLGHPITGTAPAQHDRDRTLEEAAQVADAKTHLGVMRSLEATYKADVAREIAEQIRARKSTALVAQEVSHG